ncbi:MAG: type II secretion system F family protein [Mobilitalea sp.]
MAGYAYLAIDVDGKERKGKMEAPNEDRVFHTLKADGFFPVSIKELGLLNRDIQINIGNPVKPRDLSVFSRQFVSILAAGVPIVKALQMLVEQTDNKSLKKAIFNAQMMVERGERLADAMRSQGKIFPPIFINMVEAGESSGSLEISLERISIQFEKEARLKAMVKKAMVYPIMLGSVSFGVIILMLAFVIPSFMTMFEDMDMEMPALTLAIMGMSDFVVNRWYVLVAVILVIVVGITTFKNSYTGQIFFAKLALKIPIFGKLNVKTASARFARTLSTLIASGISLMEAIDITARTMDNIIIKKMLMESKEEVARGVPLSVPILASGMFPPMVYHMTKIGEETGNMEAMLTTIANYYDEEVEVATSSLAAAMDPIIIIVLALIVGVLVLAMMQPMFSMYDQLGTTIG